MKVLIADKLSEMAVADLKSLGAEVTFEPGLTAEDLPGAIDDNEILVVRSTKVTAHTIDAGKSLSLIIRAGAGVNTIDLLEASTRGIHVANCPGKNADSVAELAIGLMIGADRRIADCTSDLRQGIWNKKTIRQSLGTEGTHPFCHRTWLHREKNGCHSTGHGDGSGRLVPQPDPGKSRRAGYSLLQNPPGSGPESRCPDGPPGRRERKPNTLSIRIYWKP